MPHIAHTQSWIISVFYDLPIRSAVFSDVARHVVADRVCIPDLRGLSAIIPDALEEEGEAAIDELREAASEYVAACVACCSCFDIP